MTVRFIGSVAFRDSEPRARQQCPHCAWFGYEGLAGHINAVHARRVGSPWMLRALDAADQGEGLHRGSRVITCLTCGLRRREAANGRCHRCAFVLALIAAYPVEGA